MNGKVLFTAVVLFSLMAASAYSAPEPPATEPASDKEEEPRPGKCLTEDEAELAQLINKWRKDNGLPAIRVTGSLYRVAKWHVIDLGLFAPHKDKTDSRDMPCDLHSWSDKGEGRGGWKPVCYTADHYYAKQMWYKPKEIADYTGVSYENIYWTSAPLSPAMVLTCWENRVGEKELLLEQSYFKNSRWKAMGVGIYGNYASVWIGDKVDHEDEMVKCEDPADKGQPKGTEKPAEGDKPKDGDKGKAPSK
jgi:hypothetical protein